jgi:hypothetical protein
MVTRDACPIYKRQENIAVRNYKHFSHVPAAQSGDSHLRSFHNTETTLTLGFVLVYSVYLVDGKPQLLDGLNNVDMTRPSLGNDHGITRHATSGRTVGIRIGEKKDSF